MIRVRGIDLMMLYGETPNWQMHVSALAVLDPSGGGGHFDPATFKSLIAERLALAPVFRCKVTEVGFGLDRPVLVDDGDFDLDLHFHHIALPGPGSERQLGHLAGLLMSKPLDRSHALWEMWLIEGLEGGRFATLTKIHHALVDGASGVDLTGILMDPGPVPTSRPVPELPAVDPPPSPLSAAVGASLHLMATPLRAARYAAQLAEQAMVAGRHLLRGSAVGLPFTTGRSSLNGRVSARRDLAFAEIPLTDARAVKAAFGVTVNDVVLAVVSGALRSYLLQRRDLPFRSLVAEMPVDIRTERTRADVGTRVANTFVSLATDVADPVERLRAIHRSSVDAKAVQRDLGAHKHIDLSEVLPPVLTGAAVRGYTASGLEDRIPPIYSVIVSNVRGPDSDLYMSGARVVGLYPMGPLLYASGLNITALTIGERIHFGVLVCPDIVDDPWAVAELLPTASAELAGAATASRDRGPARTAGAPRRP